MSEIQHIRGFFKSVCVGPAWHGPSLAENLKDVTAQAAAAHPIPGGHSIWEIVNHVSTWEHEVAKYLQGKPYVTLTGEDDWPPVKDTSEEAWQKTLADLEAGHKALSAAMQAFPETKLHETIPGCDFSWYGLMHGMPHHSLYHSGQIAILKRAAAA